MRFQTRLVLVSCFCCVTLACSAEGSVQDLESLLGDIRVYDFGRSIETLKSAEELIARESRTEAGRRQMAKRLASLLLDRSATFAARQFACRQLAITGSENEVPGLASLLLDPELADMARYALARIPHPSAQAALVEALDRATGRSLIGIIQTVGRLGPPAAETRLIELAGAADSEIATAAAAALARLPSENSVEALLQTLGNSRGLLQSAAADSCLELGWRLLHSQPASAARMFRALYDHGRAPRIRAAALRGLMEASPVADRFALAVTGLKDPDPELQVAAASLLPRVASREEAAELKAQFQASATPVKLVLIQALGQVPNAGSLELVRLAVNDTDLLVRNEALVALGSIGTAADVRILAVAAARGSEDEQTAARKSLSRVTDPAADLELVELLKSPQKDLRLEAIRALAERQAGKGRAPLLALAEQETGDVRQAAVKAVARLAVADDLPDLVNLVLNPATSFAAEESLVTTARRTGTEAIAASLLASRFESGSSGQKASIIRCLGRLGDAAGLALLTRELADADSELRLESIRSLSSWPTAMPAPELLRLARKTGAASDGILALRGYLEVVERDASIDDDTKVERYRSAFTLAADAAEKKRVVAKVGSVESFSALNLLITWLRTDGVETEAATAALGIARKVHANNLGMSRLIVQQLIDDSPADVSAQIAQLKREIEAAVAKQPARRLPNFALHVLNADSGFEAGAIVDVNGDGRKDVFSGGRWYEAPDWKRHAVREVPEQDGYYLDFGAVAADVDGDGRQDIVNGSWHGQDVFWLRNVGEGRFEVIPIDQPGNLETVLGVDINGDSRPDILPNTVGSMQWYESRPDPGSPGGARWVRHDLPKETAGHGVGAGDVNGDGRMDIVTPKGWLAQPASMELPWPWHPDFALGSASVPILAHDVDADGDADIVWGNGHGYGIYWLEQEARGGKTFWERRLIDRTWSQPHFLLLADLDLDGRQEIVTGKRYHAHNGNDPGEEHPLCIYAYRYEASEKSWIREAVHEGGRVGFGIFTTVGDYDGDGDLDILAPGKSGLYLLENRLR